MFRRIMDAVRRGLVKIGLLKGISNITDHKEVASNSEMFDKIQVWQDLYKGYHEPFHKMKYQTIEGQKTRKMDTLMMPKTAAAEMASLVFNEKCEISISEEKTSEFIDDVFKKNKFYKKFQDFLEYGFAHGGMVIKPYVEGDKIKLSFVTADCFIPISWSNESISEAVFPNEFRKGDKKYTHLEWHLWEGSTYIIRNEVYESTGNDNLGVKVSLEQFFPGLDEETRIDGLKKPIFSYFKPNTANNIDTKSPLGISIFANVLDTIKAIDTAFDSLHREFRLGKKRIFVPAHMLKSVIDPDTQEVRRYFDASDETYEAFNADMDSEEMKETTIELRVDEHTSAINALLNLFAMQTGFSSGTFTFDGESMKTATEVVSEQSKTFKSKQSHEIIIEAGLQDLIESILELAYLYGMFNAPEELEISVTFDDSIVEDTTQIISKQIQLVSSKLQSKKKAIMKIHGLTEDEAILLIEEINEENATATAENVDFFGTGSGQGTGGGK